MIDLYTWPTPNGYKPLLLLEEIGVDYNIIPINIGELEQFAPEFLKISPNNKIPAIVDHAPNPDDGSEPLAMFESGAILLYLADKYKQFIPTAPRARYQCLEWLFWQMGGLGPMLGQNHHFNQFAPERVPYAIERYVSESQRLYSVLDKQLNQQKFICGDAYTIADMACWPWIKGHKMQQINIADYPHVQQWFERIQQREATMRAFDQNLKG